MSKKVYDIGIIGAGVAGAFASFRAVNNYKNHKIILFDIGRPPRKRRRQLEGWLGCLPGGDGKICTNDSERLLDVVDGRKLRHIEDWVLSVFKENGPISLIKNKTISSQIKNKIIENGWEIKQNDYFHWKPEYIHALSKYISDYIENEIETLFDTEVTQILKKNNEFLVVTESGDYSCKNILLCAGRSGWRWVTNLYNSFDLIKSNSITKYGICAEMTASYLKDFNKNYLSFYKGEIEIGPLNWNGTIIPEDHLDLAISAFRSNEERWRTDKVSFNIIGHKYFNGNAVKETDRMAKLSYLLFNDRIGKEKIKDIIKKTSTISQLKEYNWLIEVLEDINNIFPGFIAHGNYHGPAIEALAAEIDLSKKLETDLDGLYVAGESGGFKGIYEAAVTGALAIDGIFK